MKLIFKDLKKELDAVRARSIKLSFYYHKINDTNYLNLTIAKFIADKIGIKKGHYVNIFFKKNTLIIVKRENNAAAQLGEKRKHKGKVGVHGILFRITFVDNNISNNLANKEIKKATIFNKKLFIIFNK